MTVADTAAIARKAEQSATTLANARGAASKLAADPNATAKSWGEFANMLAELEGAAHAWARLQQAVTYVTNKGLEFTEDDTKICAFELLAGGADDEWSGRGNDVRRARFDGIRKAANDMKYI